MISFRHVFPTAPLAMLLAAGCGAAPGGSAGPSAAAPALIAAPTGFASPEAVRYDPDQDVYFVSNFGTSGGGADVDNNGFISRMRPDGSVERPRFIEGGRDGVTLHGPRGMYIVADTLWVADADGVRGFHRRTGAPVAFVDLTSYRPSFLNDVAATPDGTVYVTDTGLNRIFRIRGRQVDVAIQDETMDRPNGITWDARGQRFILAPVGGGNQILAWVPGSSRVEVIGSSAGARYDGVEVMPDGRIIASSLADSSLYVFQGANGRRLVKTGGLPADIALDTRRMRVAAPFIALSQVEIWQIPR